jgi:diguanylate cyclase (GGDEF)-like protein/PAS domain S-box-containing protein
MLKKLRNFRIRKLKLLLTMKRMIWTGLGISVLFWFFEAGIHVFILNQSDYFAQIFHPEQHEIWMRLLVVTIFIAFGIYAQSVIEKRKQAEEIIKFACDELNQIFDTAADGMRVIDKNFNVLCVNETFSRMAKIAKDEAVGKKCHKMFRGSMCNTANCPLKLILSGQDRVEYFVEKENKNGEKIPCIITATPFRGPDGKIIGIVEDFKDITKYKKVEKELKELNEKLLTSNEKLKQLTLKDPHTDLYNHRYLEEIIQREFNRVKRSAGHLSLIMLDIDYFKSINDVYGHQFGNLILKQLATLLKKMVRQYDSVIRFGGEEFIIVSPDINKASAITLAQRILDAINISNFGNENHAIKLKVSIAVVSYFEDKVTHAMSLINLVDKILNRAKEDGGNRVYSSIDMKKRIFNEEQETNNNNIHYLKDKIKKLTKRANQSLIEAVFAFAKTIEFKDHYTGEHVENTVLYATEIARGLNLSTEEIERIRQAAILHDLGKVGISEKILLKKDKLTKEEYEEIKKHPQIGVDIIRPLKFLNGIIPLILYHHEKWNGENSCYGLKGEEIPIGARVIAIADVYQALTSDRPYRKAYSKEEAIEIIKAGENKQFDPKITNVFLKILQEDITL